MFAGHYAAAYAARGLKPAIPLWQLFVAVQAVDFVWAILILLGVEKVRVIPGFLEASPLDLYYMPYSHSLLAVLIWAVALGALYALRHKGASARMAGLIFAGAVLSHWLTDFLVHAPDLPLIDGEPKMGLGLWRSLLWSQLLEGGLLALGFWFYMRRTVARANTGNWAPWALLGFLAVIQAYSIMGEPPAGEGAAQQFAATSLISYTLFAGLAFLADRTRRSAE